MREIDFYLDALGLSKDGVEALFEEYYRYLIEENQKYNLTAVTERQDVLIKHFADSLYGANEIEKNARVLDLGSGAGFPGIPLAVVRRDAVFTLLDSSKKKAAFLREVINRLNLQNVQVICERAEEHARVYRETYDAVTARAVAPLAVLSEYALPLLKQGGCLIAYKGPSAEEEVSAAKTALGLLGGTLEKIAAYNIDATDYQRTLIIVRKTGKTPLKYPRASNKPRSMPL